jgi:hypothetical protein
VGRSGETEEDLIEFKAPKIDLGRVKERTQEILAPTVSKIRRFVQGVQASRAPTPTARGVQLREAIRGGGEALGTAQAGATKAAFALQAPEFQAKVQAALLRFRQKQIDKQREEERSIARSRIDPSSETFRSAQARLDARVGTPTRGVVRKTTVPTAIDFTTDLLR